MNSDRNFWTGLIALFVIGLAFLWPPYAIRMWNAGHYQFFVFVLAVVAWLLWSRKAEIAQSRSSPNPTVVYFLWLVIAVLIAFANITYSGLTGIVATILAVASGIYGVYGWGGLRTSGSVLWLLGFAIPLPLMMDQALIVKMQVLASELASRLLDGTGVIHFRQGVVIETPQARFMTEEACSGIRSLFSSMAAVAIYGVTARHRLWRIVINLIQTVLWVLIGNSLRVAIVVALAGSYPWIATGWGHELLGLMVFGFILLMVASADILLSGWISDHLVIDATVESEGPAGPVETGQSEPFVMPPFPLSGTRRTLLFAAVIASMLISVQTAWVRQSTNEDSPWQAFAAIDDPLESDFGDQYAGFEKQSFTHMTRGGNAMWAEHSFVYHFKRDQLRAILSIDRPWNHWHNLHVCYSNLGWTSTPSYAISTTGLESAVATDGHKHSELMLSRSGKYGFVIFSAIDRLGAHVPETAVVGTSGMIAATRLEPKQIMAALGFETDQDQQSVPLLLPLSTIQIYAESPSPWAEDDLKSLRQLFYTLREEISNASKGQRQ